MTSVGFDLHKRYITACALDETGAVIAEIRRLSTSIEAVTAWLAALPAPVTVGLEATLYWEWLNEGAFLVRERLKNCCTDGYLDLRWRARLMKEAGRIP